MNDERLRERFRALRETERDLTPPFERTLARAEASRATTRARWLWTPVAAAALGVGLVFMRPAPPPQPAPLDPGSWAMPTDVLLEIPGAELLREVPDIGTDFDGPASLRTGRNRRTLA